MGENFEQYLELIKPFLEIGLRNSVEYQVSSSIIHWLCVFNCLYNTI